MRKFYLSCVIRSGDERLFKVWAFTILEAKEQVIELIKENYNIEINISKVKLEK